MAEQGCTEAVGVDPTEIQPVKKVVKKCAIRPGKVGSDLAQPAGYFDWQRGVLAMPKPAVLLPMRMVGVVKGLKSRKVGGVRNEIESMPGIPEPTPSQSLNRESVRRVETMVRGGPRRRPVTPAGISQYSRRELRKHLLKYRRGLIEKKEWGHICMSVNFLTYLFVFVFVSVFQ